MIRCSSVVADAYNSTCLPYTGLDVGIIILIGVGVLLVGVALAWAIWRKRKPRQKSAWGQPDGVPR